MTVDEMDPGTIREGLATFKRRGVPFDQAWTFVAGPDPKKGKGRPGPYDDAMSMRDFMRRHFRAAYLNLPTANGRWEAPDADQGREVRPRVPVGDVPAEQRCKSGDGCERRAGHGRFGSFCQHHADELRPLDMTASFKDWGRQKIPGRAA